MNRLNNTRRAAVIRALVGGGSIRSVARMTGADKDTVMRNIVGVGEFCSIYQNHVLRNLPTKRVEADDIWAYVGAKEANKTQEDQGDIWTLPRLMRIPNLSFSWLVGPRTAKSTRLFMHDVRARLAPRRWLLA